ncbi:MAG TPA: diguanylate cyclase, partial [Mycobacteriales bacterium]|nr:diguanylate cyclase [Mycobacteriales bacterium]
MTRPAGTSPSPDADVRNRFGGTWPSAFRGYVAAVTALGLAAWVHGTLSLDLSDLRGLEPAFWLVVTLLVAVELRPLFAAGTRDTNGIALSLAMLFALLLGYGLAVALLAQAAAVLVTDLSKRKAPWRTAFNIGQYSLCWTAAAVTMAWTGHAPSPDRLSVMDGGMLAAAAAGAVVYFVVNQLLVTQAIALSVGRPLRDVLVPDLAHEVASNGALLSLSPLVVLAMERGAGFVPLLLPALLAVYKVAAVSLQREREALTDALTGLPNRSQLAERAHEVLDRTDGSPVALLLFDLDRFKEVNDTLGHHAGDHLLRVLGQRLTAALRPDDVPARLGGDEFAVVLPGTTAEEAVVTGQRLSSRLCAPVELDGVLVDVGVSIGIAVSPQHGTHLEDLLQRADVAMYLAKESGGGVEVYDSARDRNSAQRLALAGELRRALAEDELVLHYQPKADLTDGRVIGVEALVRWQHPVR